MPDLQDIHDIHYNAILHDYDTRVERLQRRRHPIGRLIRASIWDFFLLLRDAWLSLLGFALLTAVSTCYLVFFYNDHARAEVEAFHVDTALYETMLLMSLESGLPLPINDPLGEALFFIVPVLGLALVFQSVLNFSRLVLDKSSRIEYWQVSLAHTYKNHIIVCGLGNVSYRVILQLLEAKRDVVVIEKDWDSEYVDSVLSLKVPVILGDARNAQTLQQARIQHAHSLIAATHEDLINIEIGLAARRRQSKLPIVLRIFNDELDTNLENRFGHNSAFSASALAAPTFATAAMGRSIAHVLPLPPGFTVGDPSVTFLGVMQLTIARNSQLIGPPQACEDRFGVRILRHIKAKDLRKHGVRLRQPRTARQISTELAPGDIVVLLGPMATLEQLRQLNEHDHNQQQAPLRSFSLEPLPGHDRAYDSVIVCGLGKVGYRVVSELLSLEPRPRVVVVCSNDDTPGPFLESLQEMGVPVIFGDARRSRILQEAGIDRACSVVAVTSNDLINLQIGLAAQRLHKDIDLVLRVFSDTLAERLSTLFGVHTTFSIAALAAPTLAAAGVVHGIDYAIEIGEQVFSAATIALHPGDKFIGLSIAELREQHNLLVIAVRRDKQPIQNLSLDTRLQLGDELVLLADIVRLSKLDPIRLREIELHAAVAKSD
jgi:K+ transport systems, NAD-binding component